MTRVLILFCLLIPAASPQETEIRAMLRNSEAAWNRGDLKAFVTDYEDSPDTTFIGNEVVKGGRAAILGRYQRRYSTRAAMGALAFSEIEVRPLAPNLALAAGRYSLKRTAEGGGDASGRFTLVLRKGSEGWKIIHDHSS